ncbi:uncharacterized protein LOC122245079 [Penaeus japonicus]|uniref:uncharacterized protein LOC122245079 n=1 Tax=Penaeus japonicus TaxID=27405 RepID=UPI001C70B75C|nr:uncharacterized protein LOC122245079 [Penaeus japonicus]
MLLGCQTSRRTGRVVAAPEVLTYSVSCVNLPIYLHIYLVPSGTRQLANQNYGICIKAENGYCGITWQRNKAVGNNSFTVSGNVPGTDPSLVGTPAAVGTGAECTTDYVIIPGGVDDNQNSVDRFCGLGFPNSVTSTMKPFVLYVHTDGDRGSGVANRGFNMQYRQIVYC